MNELMVAAQLQHVNLHLKLDTNWPVGEVGAPVLCGGISVGILMARNYGCVFIDIGGIDLLRGPDGAAIASLMAEFVNRQPVELQVENGSHLHLCLGEPPLIDGMESGAVKVGCGSAILATFAWHLRAVADEVIVVDPEIGGLFTENSSGEALGLQYSGVKPRAKRYYAGRYHYPRGDGWGGTVVRRALDAVESVDMQKGRPGMTILVIENTGKNFGLLQVGATGQVEEILPTPAAIALAHMVHENSQPSEISGLLYLSLEELPRPHSPELTVLDIAGAPVRRFLHGNRTVAADLGRMQPGASITASTAPPGLNVPVTIGDYRRVNPHGTNG